MARDFAAVLIDFENVFYFLKNHVYPDGREITEIVVEMIRSLNTQLLKDFDESVISMDAYADFDRIEEASQSELYLVGVETHNVLGTETKNAADMRLCIDTLDILYNRPEIRSFVFVAGDRDYIPVIQYLKKRGRIVRVVGFPKSTSGDLVAIVGVENFIPATKFIPLSEPAPSRPSPLVAKAASAAAKSGLGQVPTLPAAGPASQAVPYSMAPQWQSIPDEIGIDWEKYELAAIEIAFKYFRGKADIWLTPYLNKLRGEMPELTEPERKRIVSHLEAKGAFRVVKRTGELNDYSVICLNWNHPLIRDRNPGA
ncbi:MAG: NYN domain-containing protein [Acidobacteria bacterium]|nr:NYN domain-containing protein [Acidobacteriota bacterium]